MANDDGWGPSTAVHGSGARRVGRAFTPPPAARDERREPSYGRPEARRPVQRDRPAERRPSEGRSRPYDSRGYDSRGYDSRGYDRSAQRAPERGVPWWAALGVLIAIAALGGIIDTVGSIRVQGGFNIGIVVASGVAILIVKRSHMFPVVIAPPIVYSLAAVFQLYLHGGPQDKKALLDAAANYLVYGFPAIAAASALVLIVAGVRLIARK